MQIRFYANLRTITKHEAVNISDPGIRTLRQLMNHLISLYPEIVPHLLDEHGNLRSDVPIFVNGRNPRLEEVGFDQGLGPEDVISIFSPIASGRMNVEGMRTAPKDEKE